MHEHAAPKLPSRPNAATGADRISGSGKAASVAARIEAIRHRHRALDRSVEIEHMRPLPDAAVLKSLKRERLRLKDKMQSYEGLLRALARPAGATS